MAENVEIKPKVYQVDSQEISEDTAVYLQAWFEAVKDRYETFDEFIRDAGRERIFPYLKDKGRSEIVNGFLKEHQKSGVHDLMMRTPETMSEMIEVKVQLPKPVYDVIVELCAIGKIPIEEHLQRSIISDLEADARSNFEGYMEDLVERANTIVKALEKAEVP